MDDEFEREYRQMMSEASDVRVGANQGGAMVNENMHISSAMLSKLQPVPSPHSLKNISPRNPIPLPLRLRPPLFVGPVESSSLIPVATAMETMKATLGPPRRLRPAR